jgi:Protein of unknown function (DUF3570)
VRSSLAVAPALFVALFVAVDAGADGPLTVHAGSELAVYQDTDATTVVSPVIFAGVENVLSGWGVNGSLLVDVVSTASADIVATASSRWSEVRFAPALSGHRRFGDVDVSLRGGASSEPDYLSVAGGTSISVDLAHKMVTPTLTYDFAHDTLGRAGTPFSLFSRPIARHTMSLGVGLVINKSTVFVPSVTAVVELGDSSKPYRFIPMFSEASVQQVQAGMTAAQLDPLRLDFRPLEQLPTERQRWALDGRLLHRFTSSTLRVDQRFYADTWGLKATTTDARYFADVSPRVRLGGHARLHAQTSVSFWRLAYVATETSQGPRVPALRTEARELGKLYTPTLGMDLRWALDHSGRFAVTFAADLGYTKFIDQLFIDHRVSFLGSTLFEMDIE